VKQHNSGAPKAGAPKAGAAPRTTPRMSARGLALVALERIDDGGYANLVTAQLLNGPVGRQLDERDRHFVTELVHGSVRMQRALDWVWSAFVNRRVDDHVRRLLRLGTYQILYLRVPPHAAVSETVAEARPSARGFTNAVLRKVASSATPSWPDLATELSIPDWILELLRNDLGADVAEETIWHMNTAPSATVRADGYTQDLASQWVCASVEAKPGELILDLCAAPGGKTTSLAADGAGVVAGDVHLHRAGLVRDNAARTGVQSRVGVVALDGRRAPFRPGSFDRILLDVPCSGLGVLHRRPDARWRITPADLTDLAVLQRALIDSAVPLLRSQAMLVLSACTLTNAESIGLDDYIASNHPQLTALETAGHLPAPWHRHGRGARLLPQDANTDGMVLFRYRAEP
jgi:16S rRNA (cytosine967-C5)-methyltransferase